MFGITMHVTQKEGLMKIFALVTALLFAIPAYAVTYQGGSCVKDCMSAAEWEANQRAVLLETCGIEVPAGKSVIDVVVPIRCAADDNDDD